MERPYDFVHAVTSYIFASPERCAQEKKRLDVRQTDDGVQFSLFLWREGTAKQTATVLVPVETSDLSFEISRRDSARTSRSYSSGPANGSRRYDRISMPGATNVEGDMATFSESGESIAR